MGLCGTQADPLFFEVNVWSVGLCKSGECASNSVYCFGTYGACVGRSYLR